MKGKGLEFFEEIEKLKVTAAKQAAEAKEEREKSERERARRRKRLWNRWPRGVTKCETVLRFIADHPPGLSEASIRQFVWEMNGYRGKAPAYYWMTILRYPENEKLSLLEGWCEKVGTRPNVWCLRAGEEIKPPFLRPDTSLSISAEEYRRLIGNEPQDDGIQPHGRFDRECPDRFPRPPEGTPWEDYAHHSECGCPFLSKDRIYKHQCTENFWEHIQDKLARERDR